VVLGVDTHKDVHVAAVLSELGALHASNAFPATAAGYRRLVGWARSFGMLRRAGVECTGSYGAALTRHLRGEGIDVIEVNQPDNATRRKRGNTDALDAEAAGRAVLYGLAAATAKTSCGPVEAIRVVRMARNSAVNARTKAINQLKARPGRGLHRLRRRPVARVAAAPTLGGVPLIAQMSGHLTLQRRLHGLLDQVRQHTTITGQPKTIELGLLHQPRHLPAHLGRQPPIGHHIHT
jgi:transposase